MNAGIHRPPVLTRRALLRSGSLAAAGLAAAGLGLAAERRAVDGHAIPYGAAVQAEALRTDAAYREAVAARCQMIVPEGGLKWADLRPAPDQYRFEAADGIAAFARDRGLALRGHTLAWYGAMPDWVEAIAGRREAERVLTEHIHTVVSRYRGLVPSWDVVNEALVDDPAGPDDLRPFVWSREIGRSYIPLAFKAAAEADPEAELVLNEYDIEFAGPRFAAKRTALLRLARSLVEAKVPIQAIGLQAHLPADRAIDRDGLTAFAAEIKALGLKILVTELDVIDDTLPGPIEERDAAVAAKAGEFLDAVFAGATPAAILTWGLSDRYTWVPTWFRRRDGRPNRPLPLDAAMQPKPLMAVIDRYRRIAG